MTLASCTGRQGEAEKTVANFMEANLNEAKQMKITDFSRLDSTNKVKDSTVVAIRNAAEQGGRYRRGISYAPASKRGMLYIVRVNYRLNNDEHSDTYYLNETLDKVVAVKNN